MNEPSHDWVVETNTCLSTTRILDLVSSCVFSRIVYLLYNTKLSSKVSNRVEFWHKQISILCGAIG